LYEAATWDDPIDGMFSFFPCLTGGDGFPRPEIDLPEYVSPGLMMNIQVSEELSRNEVKRVWSNVASQVINQGLQLGVQADPPEKYNQLE
jgi:hypothetical protein